MDAWILGVGTELALGQTVDTNSAWIAQRLAEAGIATQRHITVADEVEPIRDELARAAAAADIVIVTGGLGPTVDDLTRDALAAAMGVELKLHHHSLERIRDFFARRNIEMPEPNRVQAMIPVGATAIDNATGTAPGIRCKLARADIFILPGVPSEMKAMFAADVWPALVGRGGGGVILQTVLRTYGSPESELGAKIADLMARGRNPNVGTTASDAVIGVRINATGHDEPTARRLMEQDAADVRRRLGRIVFGEGDVTLQEAVAELLFKSHRTVATAESCTGGLVAKRLTDISGSSKYFLEGVVTYSNPAKHRLLGVPTELLDRHGAVSREVCESMASGCRRISNADYAVSVTGVAGPTGGTADKPVGLVYVGLASAKGCDVHELRLGDHLTREQIRDRTAKAALNMLRLALMA